MRKGPASPLEATRHLLRPRRWSLGHAWAREGARSRLVLVLALSSLFVLGAFAGARWLFERFLEVEFLAELLIERVLGIVLLFLTGLLTFSSLMSSFTALFLAPDLALLVAAPMPAGRLFLSRFVEIWIQSSWMMIVFGLPILAGCGPVLALSMDAYLAMPLVLLPLTVIAASAGSMLAMVMARWLPARRTYDMMLILGVIGFLVMYMAFRLAEPERFLEPDGLGDLVSLIAELRGASASASPSNWALAALFAIIRGEHRSAALPLATLWTGAAAMVTLAVWLARATLRVSYGLAQEGRRAAPSGRRAWQAVFTQDPERALRVRESRTFFRTPSQWTQLLLLAALAVVYLFNFRHFRALTASRVVSTELLFFLNALLSGLVTTTVAARFLFPAASLEGRALWTLRVAPVSTERLLRAKLRWGEVPLHALGVILVAGSNLVVDVAPWLILASVAVGGLGIHGLSGLAIGMGAVFLRPEEENPARLASGMSGVLFMLSGMLYLVSSLALLGWPLHRLFAWSGGAAPPSGAEWGWGAGLLAAALALAVLVRGRAMRAGARALAQREG